MPKNFTATVAAEAIKEQNRPIELHEIFLDQQTLHLAAYPTDIDFFDEARNPVTYTGFSITRSSVNTNISSKCDEVTVELGDVDLSMSSISAFTDLVGRRYRIICVFLDNILDPLTRDPDDYIPVFEGKINDPPQIGEAALSLRLIYSLDFLGLTLPRRKYQRNCTFKFGSAECGQSLGTVTGTVTNIDVTGLILTLSGRAEAADYFKDGALIIGTEHRRILASNAGLITVDYPFDYAIVTNNYSMRRGCDKTYDTCNTRFSNTANYGGFLSIPAERTLLRL